MDISEHTQNGIDGKIAEKVENPRMAIISTAFFFKSRQIILTK
jgi:hypothetical protein